MKHVDREVARYLSLLRRKIEEKGFTQLEVQEALSWGRSYISQLLNQQKALRLDQVLLVLDVIGVQPAEFFADLYPVFSEPGVIVGPGRAPREAAGPAEELRSELGRVSLLLRGLVKLLVEKRVIRIEDLRQSTREATEFSG